MGYPDRESERRICEAAAYERPVLKMRSQQRRFSGCRPRDFVRISEEVELPSRFGGGHSVDGVDSRCVPRGAEALYVRYGYGVGSGRCIDPG